MMNGLSQKEREEAILEAFKKVERNFTWDTERTQWISTTAANELFSDFDKQKQQHPITHPYDRQILSRMMIEVSMADGQMNRSEREWLTMLINPEHGTIEQIAQFPPLTNAELSNCSNGQVRTTMLMIACAISMCDEDLDQQEILVLERLSSGLGLNSTDKQNATKWAQSYILEQAISYIQLSAHGNPQTFRNQILSLATKIGLSEEDALNIEAKVKRRQSNF
jgi:tellurite resistance protein